MTGEQIKVVKRSWLLFQNINPEIVADAFYTRLFVINPELRKFFPTDMTPQYKKLIQMLSVIVARLDKLEDLKEEIIALAIRHKSYGARPEHYEAVGNALLWTLEKGMGRDWDKNTAEAWTQCYVLLSNTMINAASDTPQYIG